MILITKKGRRVVNHKVRDYLSHFGFSPVQGSKKEAGIPSKWTRADGATAAVSYGLSGGTGQSAGCAGWVYFVSMEAGR